MIKLEPQANGKIRISKVFSGKIDIDVVTTPIILGPANKGELAGKLKSTTDNWIDVLTVRNNTQLVNRKVEITSGSANFKFTEAGNTIRVMNFGNSNNSLDSWEPTTTNGNLRISADNANTVNISLSSLGKLPHCGTYDTRTTKVGNSWCPYNIDIHYNIAGGSPWDDVRESIAFTKVSGENPYRLVSSIIGAPQQPRIFHTRLEDLPSQPGGEVMRTFIQMTDIKGTYYTGVIAITLDDRDYTSCTGVSTNCFITSGFENELEYKAQPCLENEHKTINDVLDEIGLKEKK